MKNTIIILMIIFVNNLFFGQNVFDKFEEVDEITSVVVSKKMFEMMANVKISDQEGQKFLALAKNLNNLKVFTTSHSKYRSEMKSTFEKYLETKKLEKLMSVSEQNTKVRIYINQGEKTTQIKELLMFIDGNDSNSSYYDTSIILLTGNFDLNDISALVDKMNIPGGEELKKASKNKQQ